MNVKSRMTMTSECTLLIVVFLTILSIQGCESLRRKPMPCEWWKNLTDIIHLQKISCNHDDKCLVLNCTGFYKENEFSGGVILSPCESSPHVTLWLNAPTSGIPQWKHDFSHDHEYPLSSKLINSPLTPFVTASIVRNDDTFNVSIGIKACNGSKPDEECPVYTPLLRVQDITVEMCRDKISSRQLQANNLGTESNNEQPIGKPCKTQELFKTGCGKKYTCVQDNIDSTSGHCMPLPPEDPLTTPIPSAPIPIPYNQSVGNNSGIAVGITICVLIAITAAIAFVVYRYKLIGQFRVWFHRLRSPPSDQMPIGNYDDDDAPVA